MSTIIGREADKVDYLMNSSQEKRMVALLIIECRLDNVCGYGYNFWLREDTRGEVGLKCNSGKLKKAVVVRKIIRSQISELQLALT